jgi:hypothetical protein
MLKKTVMAFVSLWAAAAYAQGSQELQGLEQQLNSLGDRIQRLQDLTEVEIVQDAYGYYVDKAQWHYLADLFAPDATLEIGGKGVFWAAPESSNTCMSDSVPSARAMVC